MTNNKNRILRLCLLAGLVQPKNKQTFNKLHSKSVCSTHHGSIWLFLHYSMLSYYSFSLIFQILVSLFKVFNNSNQAGEKVMVECSIRCQNISERAKDTLEIYAVINHMWSLMPTKIQTCTKVIFSKYYKKYALAY